jgi:cytoskeletal protein CcmA (bactofilin family)
METAMNTRPPEGAATSAKTSVLAADLVVTGIIATEGALEIHGKVEGEVAADALVVGQTGSVTGKARANRADIRGTLNGDLACTDLMLRASADLQADTTCVSLTVETGAKVQGMFKRPPPPRPAAEAKPAAAAAPASAPAAPAAAQPGVQRPL